MTMKISHAKVRFFDDNKIVIVKTSAIRHFHPKNANDFNRRNLYDVKWTDGDENDHNNGKYFLAQILFLGTSDTDIQEKSSKGRIKFSKANTSKIFDDLSDKEESEEDERKKKTLKDREISSKMSQSVVAKKILDEKKKQIKKSNAEDACNLQDKNETNMKDLQDEIFNLKKQVESLTNKFTTENLRNRKVTKELNEKINKINELEAENKILKESQKNQYLEKHFKMPTKSIAELSDDLQIIYTSPPMKRKLEYFKTPTKSIAELSDDPQIIHTPSPIKRKMKFEEKACDNDLRKKTSIMKKSIEINNENITRYVAIDDKVYLGDSIFLDKDKWEYINEKEDSMFIKDLLLVIWRNSNVLVNRCLDDKKPLKQLPGRSPRKKLTPKKLKLLEDAYVHRMKKKNMSITDIMKGKKKIGRFISEKINDLQKAYAKRETKRIPSSEKINEKVDEGESS